MEENLGGARRRNVDHQVRYAAEFPQVDVVDNGIDFLEDEDVPANPTPFVSDGRNFIPYGRENPGIRADTEENHEKAMWNAIAN